MTKQLKTSITRLKQSSEKHELFGTLFAINGSVEVPNRDGFVYVKLRDNQSEIIQAFNETVSPVNGLPVKLKRLSVYYYIVGRDVERYSDWQSFSPFLPRHGDQHSFNETGGGGDIVWVYGKQFMPMLAIPSGTDGGPNLVLSQYIIQRTAGDWVFSGNTGTANIIQHKPTGNTAIMALVYVNQQNGVPGLIINSGTHFNNALTGTASIVPFLPSVTNPQWLPAMAVRLTSGTSSIGWGNMYDVRQYYGGMTSTGTGGGTPGGSNTQIQFNDSGAFGGDSNMVWDNTNKIWRIGPSAPSALATSLSAQVVAASQNSSVSFGLMAYGTGTSGNPTPTFAGYRMRGTTASPTVIADNDGMQLLVGAGYDGSNFINSARIRASAQGDWSAGARQGSKWEMEVTASGTTNRSIRFSVFADSVNIPDGTYNISGTPHQHILPNGLSVLASTFNLTDADGVYEDTGLSITLPLAGTYLLDADVRAGLEGTGVPIWFIVAKLFNSTDNADVANSETMILLSAVSDQLMQATAPIKATIQIASPKTIKLYAFRDGGGSSFTSSDILSDANGRTRLRYTKIG